jgi:hypothetical protein
VKNLLTRVEFIEGAMKTALNQEDKENILIIRDCGEKIYAEGGGTISFLLACREIIDDMINRMKKEILEIMQGG